MALVSLSKTLNHNCFVLRMGRKAVGPMCCVMHVKEPMTLIVKEKVLAPVFLDSRLEHPAGWICARYKSSVLLLLLLYISGVAFTYTVAIVVIILISLSFLFSFTSSSFLSPCWTLSAVHIFSWHRPWRCSLSMRVGRHLRSTPINYRLSASCSGRVDANSVRWSVLLVITAFTR